MEAIEIATITEHATWVICHQDHHFHTPPGPILGRLLYGQPSDALQPPIRDQGNLSVQREASPSPILSRTWLLKQDLLS